MKYREIACGMLETNAWVVFNEETRQAIVFDAPPESYQAVMSFIDEKELELKALLITHPHWDHYLDAEKIHQTGVPVYCHKDAVEYLTTPSMIIPEMLDNFDKKLVKETIQVRDGESLDIAGLEIVAYSVPGHCPGSLAFYIPEGEVCITGDVLFAGSVGRSDLPGGDFELLKYSITDSLYVLPDETAVLPGHGPRSSIGLEKRINAFVRE